MKKDQHHFASGNKLIKEKYNVICPYCDKPAQLVSGVDIYPHRNDLFHRFFWKCDPCKAWVGCHEKANRAPLGRLANAELRKVKQSAHAIFDPLWKTGRMKRSEAYSLLSNLLGISKTNCHIGMMDVDQCKVVVSVLKEHKI